METNIALLIQGLSELISQGTSWEQEFYNSVKTQFDARKGLSERQVEILNKIASNYSPEAIRDRAEWNTSYDNKKQEIAIICAHYYETTGYFHSLSKAIINEPDFVPSLKQYRSMCENKFTTKVLEAHFKEPNFPVGCLAQMRAGHSSMLTRNNPLGKPPTQSMVVVLRNDLRVTSAAKGSKRYEVVKVGGIKPFECEERDLKKLKKVKNVL